MADNNDPYSEIAMLVHRYADAVVHRNGEQWSSTWAEDAVWDLEVEGSLKAGCNKELWYGAMQVEATIQTVLNGGVESIRLAIPPGRWYPRTSSSLKWR